MNPFTKQYLMTAGPTPVPPAVSQAMAAPMLYHRAPAFDELYERVLACAAGKFGERWIGLCEAYGAELVRYEPGWGERLDPAEVDRLLGENDGIRVAFATLSETSTGIVHDVQAIAEVAARHGAMLAVDAVSGLGATELRQDD